MTKLLAHRSSIYCNEIRSYIDINLMIIISEDRYRIAMIWPLDYYKYLIYISPYTYDRQACSANEFSCACTDVDRTS